MENSLEDIIIELARKKGYVTVKDVMRITEYGPTPIKKALKRLEKDDLIICTTYKLFLNDNKKYTSDEIADELKKIRFPLNTYICFLKNDLKLKNESSEENYNDIEVILENGSRSKYVEKILKYLNEFGFITYTMATQDLGISKDAAKKHLKRLSEDEIVETYHSKKLSKILDDLEDLNLKKKLEEVLKKSVKVYILKSPENKIYVLIQQKKYKKTNSK